MRTYFVFTKTQESPDATPIKANSFKEAVELHTGEKVVADRRLKRKGINLYQAELESGERVACITEKEGEKLIARTEFYSASKEEYKP